MLLAPAFVDVGRAGSRQSEEGTDYLAAEHVVQIGHRVVAFVAEFAEEAYQSSQALVVVQVDTPETDVDGHPSEQGLYEGTAQHRDVHLRILAGKAVDDGHRHGHVAEGRKAYHQQLHYFLP